MHQLATAVLLLSVTSSLAQGPFCPGPSCPPCLDIVFVVDNSASIGPYRFNSLYKQYMNEFSYQDQWSVGRSDRQYQMAVVTYSNTAVTAFTWASQATNTNVKFRNAVNAIPHLHGLTNIGDGLLKAREEVLEDEMYNRGHCPDYCVILTNGGVNVAKNLFAEELPKFHRACNRVFALGVLGDEVTMDNLTALAKRPEDAIAISYFSNFSTVAFPETAQRICGDVCPVCQDILIIADSSSSVGTVPYRDGYRNFILNFASNAWRINQNETRVALIQFSTQPLLRWNWEDPQNRNRRSLRNAILATENIGGVTNLGAAMKLGREEVLANDNRPECPNRCIVITAGGNNRDNDLLMTERVLLKEQCERVIAFGVLDEEVTLEHLQNIASDDRLVVALDTDTEIVTVANEGFDRTFPAVCGNLPKLCPKCADVVTVLDASGSIGSLRWETRVLPFIQNFGTSERWTVKRSQLGFQVAPVVFSTTSTVPWRWKDPQTASDASFLANTVPSVLHYVGQLTNLGQALQDARVSLLNDSYVNRERCVDWCLVLTDSGVNVEIQEFQNLFLAEKDAFIASCGGNVIGISTTDSGMDSISMLAPPQYQLNVPWNMLLDSFELVENIICSDCPTQYP